MQNKHNTRSRKNGGELVQTKVFFSCYHDELLSFSGDRVMSHACSLFRQNIRPLSASEESAHDASAAGTPRIIN
jgi:hypothetical protein